MAAVVSGWVDPTLPEAGGAREDLLIRTFVELAAVSVGDFDLELVSSMVAQRCVELFSVAGAGVVLSDPGGGLRVTASTNSATMRAVQLLEIRAGHGPCIDCYRTGRPISAADLRETRDQWPRFAPAAWAVGFQSVHAVPVRVRDHVVGALNLFRSEVGTLSHADVLAAQALAHAMAFTILREQPSDKEPNLSDAVRPALDDVLILEQAKGVLAGRARIGIDEASERILRYTRYHQLDLDDVCGKIVGGTLNLLTAAENAQTRRRNP